jgi:WD40 repeat protein
MSLLSVLHGNDGQAFVGLEYTPDGRLLVVATLDGIFAYCTKASRLLHYLIFTYDQARCIAVSADSQRVVFVTNSGVVREWTMRTDTVVPKFIVEMQGFCMALSPDSLRLVIPTSAGLQVCDLDTGLIRWNALVDRNRTRSYQAVNIAISSTGSHMTCSMISTSTAQDDVYIHVWRFIDGRLECALKHPLSVRSALFMPNSLHLATACDDGYFRIFDLSSPTHCMISQFQCYERVLFNISFSPDAQCLACTAQTGNVLIFKLRDHSRLVHAHTLRHSKIRFARFLAWHPNCQLLSITSFADSPTTWIIRDWDDRIHHLFPAGFKAIVFTLVCTKARLDRHGNLLPRLPMAVWLQIFHFLHIALYCA